MSIQEFSDEQSRVAVNLEMAYQAWIDSDRELHGLPYALSVKNVSGAQYVIERLERSSQQVRSHGRADEKLIEWVESIRRTKTDLKERLSSLEQVVKERCMLYRALKLPMLPSEAGEILRHADRRRLLDGTLMVVGTNALPAYIMEANAFMHDAPQDTMDFDLAWIKEEADDNLQPVWDMLKAVDGTYTVNSERPFQARNRKAYEVEILASPSRVDTMNRKDRPTPVPLPEQEWLLMGRPVNQIVSCRDNKPARLVVPDPRFFALHKLWMADQDKRNPLKRPKDRKQGNALLNVVSMQMLHYRLDEEFEDMLPAELIPFFQAWKESRMK